ncbi:acyl-CoA carboxylase subunit beta [Rhizomonospora bruguierae]|uniref:acyl-CoA carboxylase subunit beta n=1 Tax=Rhizomonospora bruguierae TaxID=1581705 RepID=UPI001BCF49DF|nr:carboxyl transferase domain-containing protein [Micromonospora sp. NBRC 107566]
MTVLDTAVDPRTPSFADNAAAMSHRLTELAEALEAARAGGGERYVTRHHARGRLLPRERIELLVDRDSPFLELSPVTGWGTGYPVGAGVVTGLGVIEGVECVVVADDATVPGRAANPYAAAKVRRAARIALTNRLPLVALVESDDGEAPADLDAYVPVGGLYRDVARLSAARMPSVAVVFGNAVGDGAYLPGVADCTVMVRNQAKVSLAGPATVTALTGERPDDESLGGAEMHANTSGLADFLAEDERDAVRLARQCVRRLNWRKLGPGPRSPLPEPPKYDPDELLAIASADLRTSFDPREVLARVLDGSEFDEFKPGYGEAMVTGWGELHGYPVGVVANARGLLGSAEAQKAAHFVQLANASETPLLFLQNSAGQLAGAEQERRGAVKHGALLLSAVANSTVPHLAVQVGAAYGVGSYALSGRSFQPRFLFRWPNARTAAMPPDQVSALLSALSQDTGRDGGEPGSDTLVRQRMGAESGALFLSGRLYDDGVIDPRDTRTVLGICLSAIASGPIEGAGGYGVLRM